MFDDEKLLMVKALEKIKIFALVVLFLFVLGGVCEYKKYQTPLDSMVVVVKIGDSGAKVKEESATTKEVKIEKEVIEQQEKTMLSAEESQKAIDGFVGYIGKVNKVLDELDFGNSLDRVIPREIMAQKVKEEIPFKDGQIEIYDSAKGVVAVEETVKENEGVEEKNIESQKDNNDEGKVIENKE